MFAMKGLSSSPVVASSSSPAIPTKLIANQRGDSGTSQPALADAPLADTDTAAQLMSLIETAADGVQPAAASPESLDPESWPSWLRYMSTVDDDSNRLVQLRQELGREVQMERYQAAAAVKAQLKELEQKDALASVLNELQVALASEDYPLAARLRDEGVAGLAGWWAGSGGSDDPTGHLLHVTQAHGRWQGRTYTARELMQLRDIVEAEAGLGPTPSKAEPKKAAASSSASYEVTAGAGGLGSKKGVGAEAEAAAAAPRRSQRSHCGEWGGPGEVKHRTVVRLLKNAISDVKPATAAPAAGGGSSSGAATKSSIVTSVLAKNAGGGGGSSGGLAGVRQRLAAAAPVPPAAAGTGSDPSASSTSSTQLPPGASPLKVAVQFLKDGSVRISGEAAAAEVEEAEELKPRPPKLAVVPPKSKFLAWEADEALATLAALRAESLSEPSPAAPAAAPPSPTTNTLPTPEQEQADSPQDAPATVGVVSAAAEALPTDGVVIDVSLEDAVNSSTAGSAPTPADIAPPAEQTPTPSEPPLPAAAAAPPDLAAVRQMMVSMGIGGSELAAIEALMRSGSGKFATDVTEATPAVEPDQPSATAASSPVGSVEADVAPIAGAPAATSVTPAQEAVAAADLILESPVAETEIPVVEEGVGAEVPADESSSQAEEVQAEAVQADAIQSGPETVVTETEDGSKVSITSTSDASGDLETIDIKIEGSVATIEELLQALRQKGGAVDVKVDVALDPDSPASSESASSSSDDASASSSSSPTEVDVTATVVSPLIKPLPPVVFRSPAELTMAVRDKMTLSWRDPVPVVQQLAEAVAAAAAAAATAAEAVDGSEGSGAAADRPAPAVGPSVAPAGCGVEITLEESTGGRTYLLTLQPGSDLMDVAEHVANLHATAAAHSSHSSLQSLLRRRVTATPKPGGVAIVHPSHRLLPLRDLLLNSKTRPLNCGCSYSRVTADAAQSDPFHGPYVGSFGPHGPELLHLTHGSLDGEEAVLAYKLTGDPNVPAGQLTFRAKVGRKHRLSSKQVYPEELGIVARYKGEGRVAQAGFRSPRWVEGELLQFGANSPVTGTAALGFVWHVPNEKRFLILLNKLDLPALAKAASDPDTRV
ncbi:MAG: hypothetical protein WDW36_006206 [Sanguina aurantia]